MAVNGIEIEVGQVWRTRDGGSVEITATGDNDMVYPVLGVDVGGARLSFTLGGMFDNVESDLDLVELISPAQAKELPVQFAEQSANATQVGGVRDDLADYEEAEAEKTKIDGLAAATAENFGASAHVSAIGILDSAANHMRDRAATYDSPEGERSMGAAVTAFNAITKRTLTEAEGWLLLQVLKDVRLFQRAAFHQDSAEDCVAYAALKAEAKAKGGAQ